MARDDFDRVGVTAGDNFGRNGAGPSDFDFRTWQSRQGI
jgi:hypothetical protein